MRILASGYYVAPKREPKVAKADPPAFPDARFDELLVKGFCTAGRPDYRGMLITLLLHGAGFRESEPFHLYIGDVFPNPFNRKQAGVIIHHPSDGTAPGDWLDPHDISVESQQDYKQPYTHEMIEALNAAAQRLHDKHGGNQPEINE